MLIDQSKADLDEEIFWIKSHIFKTQQMRYKESLDRIPYHLKVPFICINNDVRFRLPLKDGLSHDYCLGRIETTRIFLLKSDIHSILKLLPTGKEYVNQTSSKCFLPYILHSSSVLR